MWQKLQRDGELGSSRVDPDPPARCVGESPPHSAATSRGPPEGNMLLLYATFVKGYFPHLVEQLISRNHHYFRM